MENNFLTDAELAATVADLKSIRKDLPKGNSFLKGAIYLGKDDNGDSLFNLQGRTKNYWIQNSLDNLNIVVYNPVDGTSTVIMSISSTGAISKIGGGSFSAISDERMKENIQPFEDGLNKVLAINPKTFNYKAVEGTPTQNYPDFICEKTQYGVIAQELETVAPEMVTTGEDGFKSVDLSNLCLLLVNAVKQQQQMILELTERVQALETPTPQA